MKTLTARVTSGRIVVEEPAQFPDGTVLNLAVVDPGDELSDEERRELHDALDAAWASVKAGRTRPGSEILAKIGASR